MDNTMLLISRAKYLFQDYIVRKLKDKGYQGISPSHGEIILQLKRNKQVKMGELAKLISRDPSTVTTLVKKLQLLRFVEIEKDENDRRSTIIYLTEDGENLYSDIMVISEQMYKDIYYNISNDEREDFRLSLEKLIENLS